MAGTWGLWATLLSAGCAGTQPPLESRETQANQAFARIQVCEAELFEADRRAALPAATCAERGAAADAGCGASAEICSLAHQLADADALTRCDRARARCQALRVQPSHCDRSGEAR